MLPILNTGQTGQTCREAGTQSDSTAFAVGCIALALGEPDYAYITHFINESIQTVHPNDSNLKERVCSIPSVD
ncbi:hypothetical protein GCM10007938_07560 [Vibrio zhanjiangensis]|uniref:ADP-ribosylglycohydrolase n=1 Tax=Vibrio zhanjiangensis TaxID=1046128 RepID=A0ABQ6EVD0_9VIBR|nr:hypothetical protein GCM10007938_07560 [Vibrio zhanjiangensis]